MSKYKYYFRKPKSEISKDIFRWIAISGMITIAATSPYFGHNLVRAYKSAKRKNVEINNSSNSKKKIYNTFYNLKKAGHIKTRKADNQIYISLTEKGRKKAGWMQINDLKIKQSKKWDNKWRIVIFDISYTKRICREALRGKLKELGFSPLQKSVWIYPFNCKDEIGLLKNFFGFTEKEFRLIITKDIGKDEELKKLFELK